MRRDNSSQPIPVFTPYKTVAITSGVAWEPEDEDNAYCVPSDCTYTIDGSDSGSLVAGTQRGIIEGSSYVFDTTMNIEVMR